MFTYFVSIVFGSLRFIFMLQALTHEIVIGKEISQVLVPAEIHHLELFVVPRIHGLGSHEGELSAESAMNSRAVHTNKYPVVN